MYFVLEIQNCTITRRLHKLTGLDWFLIDSLECSQKVKDSATRTFRIFVLWEVIACVQLVLPARLHLQDSASHPLCLWRMASLSRSHNASGPSGPSGRTACNERYKLFQLQFVKICWQPSTVLQLYKKSSSMDCCYLRGLQNNNFY